MGPFHSPMVTGDDDVADTLIWDDGDVWQRRSEEISIGLARPASMTGKIFKREDPKVRIYKHIYTYAWNPNDPFVRKDLTFSDLHVKIEDTRLHVKIGLQGILLLKCSLQLFFALMVKRWVKGTLNLCQLYGL